MKLFRFGEMNKEKPGICIDDIHFDVSDLVHDYDAVFFEKGGIFQLQRLLDQNKTMLPELPSGTRLGCPVANPSKIVCIGLNYADHARETGAAVPAEPIIFLKSTSSISGPFDNIVIPKNSVKTDWEVELAVVISKRASYVDESAALDFIAGYTLHNDVSERAFQLEMGGTWDKGKGCDTFAPLGPYLVTAKEIPDTNNLRLWLKVNDKLMQDGTTANLIFRIPFLVSYISRFMTLLPGDIISTGTPAGVGLGFKPPVFLKAGDIVTLGIDGIGSSEQNCIAYARH